MSLLKRGADAVYTFRFLKLLVTPWEKTKAYELGLLDDNGKRIKKPETDEEKSAYTYFHRLVFNMKRLMGKVPGGSTRLASFAAALFLIKEHTGITDRAIDKIIAELDIDPDLVAENHEWFIDDQGCLIPGKYTLRENTVFMKTGDPFAIKGSRIIVEEPLEPADAIRGIPVFVVTHHETRQPIAITANDILR